MTSEGTFVAAAPTRAHRRSDVARRGSRLAPVLTIPWNGEREILAFDDFEIDRARFELRRDGEVVAVQQQALDVLSYLVDAAGRVVSKEELLDNVWGTRFVSESALTTQIKMVRRALGDDGRTQRYIRTVHRRGYEFLARPVRVDTRTGARRQRSHHRGAMPELPISEDRLIRRSRLVAKAGDAVRNAVGAIGRLASSPPAGRCSDRRPAEVVALRHGGPTESPIRSRIR